MEGLTRLISYTLNSSLRGFLRWSDSFLLHPRGFPEVAHALAPLQDFPSQLEPHPPTEEDVEDGRDPKSWSGFLWGVPKRRTTQMKRLRRRFGHQDWLHNCKLMKPKTNLRICDTCGHHYEAFHLCGNCYERIKKETELIRKQADVQFGHGPEDKGIVVLYESDKEHGGAGMRQQMEDKKNIIVEIPKPRPSFFSGNLLQRTTLRVNPDATSVTPTPQIPTVVTDSGSKEP